MNFNSILFIFCVHSYTKTESLPQILRAILREKGTIGTLKWNEGHDKCNMQIKARKERCTN